MTQTKRKEKVIVATLPAVEVESLPSREAVQLAQCPGVSVVQASMALDCPPSYPGDRLDQGDALMEPVQQSLTAN